jgi:hypothetical protein
VRLEMGNCEEAVVAYFIVLFRCMSGMTEENHRIPTGVFEVSVLLIGLFMEN